MSDIKLDSGLLLDITMDTGFFKTAIKFYDNNQLYNCFANTFHTEDTPKNPIKTDRQDTTVAANFFEITIPYASGNKIYKTSEHYFQAGKAKNPEDYEKILGLASGYATQGCIEPTRDCYRRDQTGVNIRIGDGLGIKYDYYQEYWDSTFSDKTYGGKTTPGLPGLVQPDWWINYNYTDKIILPVNPTSEMDYKCGRMFNGLLFKYGMNNESSIKLREILIGTGDRILIEHTIRDAVWGDCKGVHNGVETPDDPGIYYKCNDVRPTECKSGKRFHKGCNYLGRMLMVIRHILLKNPDKYIDRDKDFYDTFFIKGVHVPNWPGLGDPTFNFTTGTPPSTSRPNLSQTPNKPLPEQIQNILRAQNGWGNKPTYDKVVKEMTKSNDKVAKKEGHWMWYIFPQFLDYRPTDSNPTYSIKNLADFETYLLHPLLNERLQRITQIITPSLSTDLNKLKTLFGVTSDTNNTDTIKFKQAMLTYIIVYCNLIVNRTEFTQAHKDMIKGSIDTCSTALSKMDVTKLNGKLEGDTDFYGKPTFFLTILKDQIGLEDKIKSKINTEQTIEIFKASYLTQLESKGVIEAVEQNLAVEPSTPARSRQRSRQPHSQSRPQSNRQSRPQSNRQSRPQPNQVQANQQHRSDSSLPCYKTTHPSNKFMLRLVGELGEVGNHAEFKEKCVDDVSRLLNIPKERVVIKEALRRGSIKVYIEIINRIGNIIVTDDDIKELLGSESINGKDVTDIYITQRHTLKHADKISLEKHLRENRESNKIHLDILEQYSFDIQDIKTVVSNKSNDYVIVYDLNIHGLEEVNYKEKESVLNRFLDS